ncbi:MAG: hypothetical protein LBR10_09595 [Prevotellaceae bacterium]|jgi:hypothetical protein|nr:hypothetical protein [Prevotellaceae bacterium]
MKYLLEIEAEDKIAFAEELFRSMDFVKVLQVLPDETANKENTSKLFAETFGMWADRDINIKDIRQKIRERRTKSIDNDTL